MQKCSLAGNAGFAGSRSSALTATAWTSLVHMGEQGFMHINHQLMQVPPHDNLCTQPAAALDLTNAADHAYCEFSMQGSELAEQEQIVGML